LTGGEIKPYISKRGDGSFVVRNLEGLAVADVLVRPTRGVRLNVRDLHGVRALAKRLHMRPIAGGGGVWDAFCYVPEASVDAARELLETLIGKPR
jgi:hypothetical protein